MSRATNPLLDALSAGDRTIVDSLPIAGKLLLIQWVHGALSAEIGDLGARLAPLAQSFRAGAGLTVPPSCDSPQSDSQTGRRLGDHFRRGLNIPPEVTSEGAPDLGAS